MISTRIRVVLSLSVAMRFAALSTVPSFADTAKSQIVDRELQSKNFASNRVGTSPVRNMVVYLRAGSDGSSERCPVISFLADPSGGCVHRAHEVWGEDGRVYTEVLPFFGGHLVLDKNQRQPPQMRPVRRLHRSD
jgi:hypothetical protein